jgi:cell wall-associated NlpC family hydrolase
VCTAAVAGALLAPVPAGAAPGPDGDADGGAGQGLGQEQGQGQERSVSELLTDLQGLYRKAEQSSEAYNATEEQLKQRKKTADDLTRKLAAARGDLNTSRLAAGRLAREQYQGSNDISPYVQLLLARDPQQALDQGHVLRRAAKEQQAAITRLVGREKKTDGLATEARAALDRQLQLTAKKRTERDAVQKRLKAVEELLASLSTDQLAELAKLENKGSADAQRKFVASGALSSTPRAPSAAGNAALRYAVDQIGKPYVWGAEGPDSFDCSGLTSQAWDHAGQQIPRTSQEQWARLRRVPVGQLRPGDLVVYFPEATHVAMYLGNGMVVQAPRPGARVKVSPIAANPVLGAVRPDPDADPMPGYEPPSLPEGATTGDDTGYANAGAPAV